MFTASELAEHRADAESLMVDTFAAFAPASATRGTNGMLTPGWTPMGTSPGKTQGASGADGRRGASAHSVLIGNTEYVVIDSGLHLPLSAFVVGGVLQLEIGWELQCTAVGPISDPAGLGRRWHVVSVSKKTWPTARRLDVAEVPPLDLS